jgi:predicted metal-dependent HD superfamily phosphohydrolase
MKGYNQLRRKAVEILSSQLPKELSYHSIEHTLNVLKTCNNYIKREKIESHKAKLLRLAALMHDIGFTISNKDHEETSKDIAVDLMKSYGFPKKDIDIVKGLILATRIPQFPKNELEKIICDCDLDYLGRSDFYIISDQLFRELEFSPITKTKLDWNNFQIKFMEAHKYHTQFALKNRRSYKETRIAELKELVEKLEKQ